MAVFNLAELKIGGKRIAGEGTDFNGENAFIAARPSDVWQKLVK